MLTAIKLSYYQPKFPDILCIAWIILRSITLGSNSWIIALGLKSKFLALISSASSSFTMSQVATFASTVLLRFTEAIWEGDHVPQLGT